MGGRGKGEHESHGAGEPASEKAARTVAGSSIVVTRPKSILLKPLEADFKSLLKALAKGVGHTATGKWVELGADATEALSAIGLSTDPGELLFLLIRRALAASLFDLIADSAQQLSLPEAGSDAVIDAMTVSLPRTLQVGNSFFDRPAELSLLEDLRPFVEQWLAGHGMSSPWPQTIVARWPSYFVFSLNHEWRRNAKAYRPVLDWFDTPFRRASEREWAWTTYAAMLRRRVEESVFDEPISLRQLFVPLNAYYSEERNSSLAEPKRGRRRVVVALQKELSDWLQGRDPQDTIRVISGGPGSGKSAFARVFAATTGQENGVRTIYVPLHLIDPGGDLVEEVGRFVREEGILAHNPIDAEAAEANLLMIFDGLDELASQGRAAAETARGFLREVERTVEKRNLQGIRLRVLISGREVVVQENESEFRRPRQILSLLPYYVVPEEAGRNDNDGDGLYSDPHRLLAIDLRQTWWRHYGVVTGKGYAGLPGELSRPELTEITSQPLLNYLVALSLTRDKLDFGGNVNLNVVYADLVAAVHERGYEKHRAYTPIRQMSLDEFVRVMEEIGLAAWHGDGRTTTVREIEEHCRASGLGALLEVFQDGARAGVTRLLAAFFFRRYGERSGGEPTFVFTHKTFGEYLAARRCVRCIDKVVRECDRRRRDPDEGWDDRDALKHWVQICGPTAVSGDLHVFFLNEIRLRPRKQLQEWQRQLADLFSHAVRFGMPMEQLQISPFREAAFQSRNSEEALLVAVNACARMTEAVSNVQLDDPTAFGAWFRRVQGQRTGPPSTIAASCLSYLNLAGAFLDVGDFYNTDFSHSNLRGISGHYACFGGASFEGADLTGAVLSGAYLGGADLRDAVLNHANLRDARLEGARLDSAETEGILLEGANPRRIVSGARRMSRGGVMQRVRTRREDVGSGEAEAENEVEQGLKGHEREGPQDGDGDV